MIQPRRVAVSAALLALVASGVAILAFGPPGLHRFLPRCVFHEVTRLNCPGCGATRCVLALAHGHLAEALRDNALIVLALPIAIPLVWKRWLVWARGSSWPPVGPIRPWVAVLIAAVVIGFGLLRNLPWPPFSWLSP